MKRWTIAGEPSPEQIDEIAATLRAGGVVLLPTDTIYGLHAREDDRDGIARIVAIKGRDEKKPFVTLASSVVQIESLGARVDPLLRDLWPAPLTAILPRGSTTIAVRVPDLDWLRALLEQSGPLISTSANRSGEPPITSPDALGKDAIRTLDGIADAGPREGKPSAIVDFTGETPHVVREGDLLFAQKLRKSLRKSL